MLDQLPDDFKDIIMDVMKDFFGDLRSHSKKRMNEIVADCIEDAAKKYNKFKLSNLMGDVLKKLPIKYLDELVREAKEDDALNVEACNTKLHFFIDMAFLGIMVTAIEIVNEENKEEEEKQKNKGIFNT
jgi:hypothetical protein|tara:strand:+ start:4350 stop:4736 length:387 start_codon:yes stop_codon:yes gene_type:complete